MGISADLYRIIKKEDVCTGSQVTDFQENMSLYELLPKEIHKLIYQEEVDSYSYDTSKEVDYVMVGSEYDIVHYTDGTNIEISDENTTSETVNCITLECLCYLGPKSSFVENIYELYDKKKSFNSIFLFNELEKIYTGGTGYLPYIEGINIDELLIDLNY